MFHGSFKFVAAQLMRSNQHRDHETGNMYTHLLQARRGGQPLNYTKKISFGTSYCMLSGIGKPRASKFFGIKPEIEWFHFLFNKVSMLH